jgi:hypothetical protein
VPVLLFSTVPELTRNAGIQLNARVLLLLRAARLISPSMKPRKPKDLAEKTEKSLLMRYSEIVKLRELVKQARSKISEEAKIDDLTDRR